MAILTNCHLCVWLQAVSKKNSSWFCFIANSHDVHIGIINDSWSFLSPVCIDYKVLSIKAPVCEQSHLCVAIFPLAFRLQLILPVFIFLTGAEIGADLMSLYSSYLSLDLCCNNGAELSFRNGFSFVNYLSYKCKHSSSVQLGCPLHLLALSLFLRWFMVHSKRCRDIYRLCRSYRNWWDLCHFRQHQIDKVLYYQHNYGRWK